MENYEVRIYGTTKRDLREIVEYLNTFSPIAALRIYDGLIEKINSLSRLPERCPLLRDPQLRIRGYRALIVGEYIVFYTVAPPVVNVTRILYARRGYEDLLR